MQLLEGPHGPVHSLSFSPDGRTLASASGRSTSIWLWDLARGGASRHDCARRIDGLAFAPGEPSTLAWCVAQGDVLVWELSRRGPSWIDSVAPVPNHRVSLGFSPDGRTLAAGSVSKSAADLPAYYRPQCGAMLWQWQQGGPAVGDTVRSHSGPVYALAFAPDGGALALGTLYQHVEVWKLPELQLLARLPHWRKVHFLTFCL